MSISSAQSQSDSAGKPTKPFALPPVSGLQHVFDHGFRLLCRASALMVIGLMVLLVVVLAYRSLPAFGKYGWRFFITDDWDPQGNLGALPFIYGTLATSFLAMFIAVPLAVGAATFLAEIAP